MSIGQVAPAEGRTFRDPETNVEIRQLTAHRAHSHHMYFTNSGLWDDGRRLLIGSHRGNAANFFSVELATGEITQLTDLPASAAPGTLGGFLNPARDEACFISARTVCAIDLRTGEIRKLWTCPDGYKNGNLSITADGQTICHVVQQDLSGKLRLDLGHGYVGFPEYHAAHPHCRIMAIGVDTGAARIAHEDDYWLGHINTSPTIDNFLTFCHEGPWKDVDQRMWTLALDGDVVKPLRQEVPGESIGHEYWFSDGEQIGYHGRKVDGVHIFGHVRHDDTERTEYDFPHGSFHFHSVDEDLIVGDGYPDAPHLLLWKLTDGRYEGPRKLLTHRGSFHVQLLHVHPRMFTGDDGAIRICYSADPQGYGTVYIADVPDFESLPEFDAPPKG